MSAGEQRPAQLLVRVIIGELKLWEAAVVRGLSVRQTRRLKYAIRAGRGSTAIRT